MVDALSCFSFVSSLVGLLPSAIGWPLHLAEATEAEIEPLVLAGVLLSLITVYLAAKVGGGAVCSR